eukprot:Tbor_TRINITY_DN5397_c2_g2::TRINITY_DN5397_c2_g2_i4::g.4429::m.4429
MEKSNKIEEALSLFSQLQAIPFTDVDDDNRIHTAHQIIPKKPSNTNLMKGSGTGGGKGMAILHSKLEKLQAENTTLQKKITLSDAIIKKQHMKNKELESRVNKLSAQLALCGKTPVENDNNNNNNDGADKVPTMTTNLPHSQLQEMITKRDAEIITLRKQLTSAVQAQESNTLPFGVPLTQSHSIMGLPSQTSCNSNYSSIAVKGVSTPYYLNSCIEKLEKDYQALLDIKLEYISEGELTGKVNKEVKKFFTHLKDKLISNERDWEIERVLWQEQVFELEQQLSAMWCNNNNNIYNNNNIIDIKDTSEHLRSSVVTEGAASVG